MEVINLATDPNSSDVVFLLQGILNKQRELKRLTPLEEPYADGSQVQIGFNPTASLAGVTA